jgi:hypothetical protein
VYYFAFDSIMTVTIEAFQIGNSVEVEFKLQTYRYTDQATGVVSAGFNSKLLGMHRLMREGYVSKTIKQVLVPPKKLLQVSPNKRQKCFT